MSEHSIAPPLPLSPPRPPAAREPAAHALWRSLLLVTGFWWLATGLIVALQRDATSRAFAALLATALALLGAWLLFRRRDDASPAGARASLIGGSLLWAWVSMTFYGGWIVGPGVPASGLRAVPGEPSLALALEAIRATSHNEAAALFCLASAWLLTRGRPNRVGFHALLGFWATHQVAKLNIFFGVVNPATRFLPEQLSFLTLFFGPERNSPLLWVSVAALSAVAWVLIGRTRSARSAFEQHAAALVGVLIALAALEHMLLGMRWDAPLWDLFLDLRAP